MPTFVVLQLAAACCELFPLPHQSQPPALIPTPLSPLAILGWLFVAPGYDFGLVASKQEREVGVQYKTFTFTSIFLQYSACHQFTMLSSKTVQVII